MTGPTDPALRALLTNRQVPDANQITITVGELRALAAAEAAPLDVERLARAFEKAIYGWYGDTWTYHMNVTEAIAREYAALRSPDTETAGGAG